MKVDDGRGLSDHKGISPSESVDGSPNKDVPGGESRSGKHIDPRGPNPGHVQKSFGKPQGA